jgi:hypothetical protein
MAAVKINLTIPVELTNTYKDSSVKLLFFPSRCYSAIGRAYAQEGAQTLSIGEGCEWVEIALHELTHCMGKHINAHQLTNHFFEFD